LPVLGKVEREAGLRETEVKKMVNGGGRGVARGQRERT